MGKKQSSPELSRAKLLPTQGEQVPANPSSQKRQTVGDSDDDKLQPKRAQLTRRNLALLNNIGKKKDFQGSTTESESQKTKTTPTIGSGFVDQAYKNGILPPRHSNPAANLEGIRKRYSKSRATASPTESEYKRYTNKVGRAPNEATMVGEISKRILKDYDDRGYHESLNQSFTGFPKNVGFNDGLSAPQPGFVQGLEKREYDPFPIDVCGAALYDDDPDSLALPHLAGEWKGRGKNMEVAKLQSAYDGVALVYARNQALSYIGKSDPPGHAEVTTFTTDGTTLNQYAHYAEESEDGTTKYHQCRIKSINLIDSHKDFKDGYKHLRNAQDHARNQSYVLGDDLKEYWTQQRSTLQPIAEGTSLPVPDLQAKSSHQASRSDGHKRKASQQSPSGSGHASKRSNKRFSKRKDY